MSAHKRIGVILVCLALAAAAEGNRGHAAIHLRTYNVRAAAGAIADGSGVDELPVHETMIETTFESGADAPALGGRAHNANALVRSGAMLAGAGSAATIFGFNPTADQFTIIMSGAAFGSPIESNLFGFSSGVGDAQTSIEFTVDKQYYVTFAATTVPSGGSLARARFGGNAGTPWGFGLASGQSGILSPLRPDRFAAAVYFIEGIAGANTGAINTFELFLSFSAVDVGPVGSSQAAPVPPTIMSDGEYTFTDAATGLWVDPPLTDGYRYTMTGTSLFTSILDFPTGFDDTFEVYVDGNLLDSYGPGDSVDFTSFSGGGVSEFLVRGINPLVDVENPAGFPLRLAYNTATADFTMTSDPAPTRSGVVPEQAALVTWGVLVMIAGGHVGRRGSGGGR